MKQNNYEFQLKKRYGEAGAGIPIVIAIIMLFIKGFGLFLSLRLWLYIIIGMFVFALLMIIPYLLVEKLPEKLKLYMMILSIIIYGFYFWLAVFLFRFV